MTEYYQGPNNSAELKVTTITLAVIVTCFVAWRIVWRFGRNLLGLSDYLLLAGWSFSLCLAGFNLDPYFRWGYGYHKADIPPSILASLTPKILFWLNSVFFKATAGTIKLSIAVIYMNIFSKPVLASVKIAQVCNYAVMGVIVCYYTAATFVSILQCDPVQKAWMADLEGHCIDNTLFRTANAYINALTSITLVITPFPVLLMRESQSKEVWQFLSLIALGLVHTGCAICRIVFIYIPNPGAATDPQWYNTSSNTIAMAEIFTALLVATIITMRPCFQAIGIAVMTTVTSSSRTRFGTNKTKDNSRNLSSTIMTSQKHKGDRDGFNKIAVTTEIDLEIELQSRDRSTEDLFVPGYHAGVQRVDG